MKKISALVLALLILISQPITVNASEYKTIDATTFKSNYKITTIHIGSDVYEISSTAFRNLNNLRKITVSQNNLFYTSYSGCLYDKKMTELLCFPPALSGATIPDSVVSIGANALHGVPEDLKQQIREVVEGQAAGNLGEWEIPGEHFVHTDNGVMWKDSSGNLVSPYSNIMNLAGAVVNASSTGDMRQQEQLEAAFYYIASNIFYARSTETPSGDWVKEYASKALSTRTGNCYGYAAAFAYVAKGLGYDARVCTGTVKSSLGGRTPHAWTEVKVGNRWYVYDTEMQSAKGGGYYKQTYGSYPAGPLEKEASYEVNF